MSASVTGHSDDQRQAASCFSDVNSHLKLRQEQRFRFKIKALRCDWRYETKIGQPMIYWLLIQQLNAGECVRRKVVQIDDLFSGKRMHQVNRSAHTLTFICYRFSSKNALDSDISIEDSQRQKPLCQKVFTRDLSRKMVAAQLHLDIRPLWFC